MKRFLEWVAQIWISLAFVQGLFWLCVLLLIGWTLWYYRGQS